MLFQILIDSRHVLIETLKQFISIHDPHCPHLFLRCLFSNNNDPKQIHVLLIHSFEAIKAICSCLSKQTGINLDDATALTEEIGRSILPQEAKRLITDEVDKKVNHTYSNKKNGYGNT